MNYVPNCNSFESGVIEGVLLVSLTTHRDQRGWLLELYRDDELPQGLSPKMSYVSQTLSGVTRGPHLHDKQTDHFIAMFGTAEFSLWDDRKDSPSFGKRMQLEMSADAPHRLTVPAGVVHAYRNGGTEPVILMNAPNQLYAGQGRQEPVDVVRFEDFPDHPFCW